MGKKIVRTVTVLICALSTMVFFQNCSDGFQAISEKATEQLGSSNSASTGLPQGLSGSAKAFNRDPFTDAKMTAADFSYDFTNTTKTVTLTHLQDKTYLANGVISLDVDDAFPTQMPSPKNSLIFTESQPQFQHTNAYYHLDRLINDLVANGQLVVPVTPLDVNPHCTAGSNSLNNAYYSPDDNLLCMGRSVPTGGQNIWAADDSDVLVHEFGHFLNHKFSTDAILSSTWEVGAMDEGIADVWAYRQNQGVHISEWYGRAIYSAAGILMEPYTGLRDLTTVPQYPRDLGAEVHTDSPYISTVFYALTQAHPEITKAQFSLLVKRTLESLQMGDGFAAALRTLRTEAVKLGVTAASFDSILTARGLNRKDDLTSVALEGTPIVIDNHAFQGFTDKGNCSGTLDAGESVVIFPDLKNAGTLDVGQIYAKLTTTASANDITILAGGDVGSYFRVLANQSYLQQEIKTQTKFSTDYLNRLLFSAFVVKAGAAATGPYTFTLTLSGMNSIDATPVKKVLTFTLNVGNGANLANDCPGTKEDDVFP